MSKTSARRRRKRNRKTLRDKAKFARDHHGTRTGDDLRMSKKGRGKQHVERDGRLTATIRERR